MKLVIVLSSVIFLVAGSYNMGFEKKNKCGCNLDYTCKNCAPCEKYRPICTHNKTKIEDFEVDHLQSCSQWYLEGYNVELVNNIDGTITVTLVFSDLKYDEQYGIELWILDDPSSNPNDNISAPLNHSTKTLRVTGRKADSSCRLMVSFNFTFLYSGLYQLSVIKKANLGEHTESVSNTCLSKPFLINSLYKKEILNDLEPSFFPVYRPQSYSLMTTMSGDGLNLAKKVFIRFSLCGERNVVMESHLKHGNDGVCCDSYGADQSSETCPCKFSDDFQTLTCTLKNLTNGHYCILVGFYDPRCKSDTIWTKGAKAFCNWSYNLTLVGNKTSMVVSLPIERVSGWTLFLLFMVIGAVLISVSISVCWYKPKCIKKLRHGINTYATTSSSESSTIPWLIKNNCTKTTSPEVLLLYPRDCLPFMNAMSEFRSFLQSNNCKVYDPWDNEIYNSVVESCETWTLPFIKNENVKIILVISECSKKFEKSFLENTVLNYNEPHTLDTIFTQSFAMIHQYFSNRFDSYKRIFVIQLSGSPPMNFEFITPGTLYSIPENVVYLIRDLRDNEVNAQMVVYRLLTLMDAVADYKYFKKANVDYLSDFLSLKSSESTSPGNNHS